MSYLSFGAKRQVNKCAVIGCSGAGAAAAYALSQSRPIDALVLIDPDKRTSDGLAADLGCALPLNAHIDLWAGDYSDLTECSMIVLALGHRHLHECAHADLFTLNLPIIRKAVADITLYAQDANILVISEPCEIMTYAVTRYADLPPHRIMGIGTLPQTLYLRKMLGKYLGADARQLDTMILGQSDMNGFPCLKNSRVCGIPIENFMLSLGRSYDQTILQSLFDDAMQAFMRAEDAKGCAEYAIGRACALVAACIFEDSDTVLPLCVSTEHYDAFSKVCMSLPCILGRHGVHPLHDYAFDATEFEQLRRTGARLRAQLLDAEQIITEK